MNLIHISKASVLFFILLCLSTISQAETLKIYHIDVEQADATLLISPTGETLLIDSGKNGHGPRIKAILDQENITNIDHFVATHYHEDHFYRAGHYEMPAIASGRYQAWVT